MNCPTTNGLVRSRAILRRTRPGECHTAFIPRFMPHGMNTVDYEACTGFIPLILIHATCIIARSEVTELNSESSFSLCLVYAIIHYTAFGSLQTNSLRYKKSVNNEPLSTNHQLQKKI